MRENPCKKWVSEFDLEVIKLLGQLNPVWSYFNSICRSSSKVWATVIRFEGLTWRFAILGIRFGGFLNTVWRASRSVLEYVNDILLLICIFALSTVATRQQRWCFSTGGANSVYSGLRRFAGNWSEFVLDFVANLLRNDGELLAFPSIRCMKNLKGIFNSRFILSKNRVTKIG